MCGSSDLCDQVTSAPVLFRPRCCTPFLLPNYAGVKCSLLTLPNSGTQWSSAFMNILENGCCSSPHSLHFLNTARVSLNAPAVLTIEVQNATHYWNCLESLDYHRWWRLARARENAQHLKCCTEGSQPHPNRRQGYCRVKNIPEIVLWKISMPPQATRYFLCPFLNSYRLWKDSWAREDYFALDDAALLF